MLSQITSKKLLVIIATVFIALLALVIAAVFVIYPKLKDKSADELNEADILQKIAANNGSAVLTKSNPAPANSTGEADSSMRMTALMPYNAKSYNYSRSEITNGPKAQECGYTIKELPSYTTESYSYFEKSGSKYYSKYLTKNQSGAVVDYSLSLPDVSYYYKGGKYAVKYLGSNNLYTLMESKSSDVDDSQTVTSSDQPSTDDIKPISANEKPTIADFFGPDAKLEGEEKIDGQSYYLINWSYQGYCGEDSSKPLSRGDDAVSVSNNKKILVKAWVDKETFMFVKQEEYLNSINSNNLIAATKNTSENKDVAFNTVSGNFSFDLNVTLKQIDPDDYAQSSIRYQNALKSHLAKQSVLVLDPTDSKFKVSSLGSDKLDMPKADDYLTDKNYYASDAYGTSQYNMYKENLASIDYSAYPEFNISFNNQSNSTTWLDLSISVYKTSKNYAKLVEEYTGSKTTKSNSVMVVVDGQQIIGKIYEQTEQSVPAAEGGSSQGNSGGGTEPSIDRSAPDSCKDCPGNWTVIFTLNGNYYAVRVSGLKNTSTDAQVASNLVFDGLDVNNSTDFNAIKNMLKTSSQSSGRDLIAL